MEGFSDGVFAIAITLLVLDLAVPTNAHSQRHLQSAVGEQWPGYLGYFVSFATVGVLWLGHCALTDYLDRANTSAIISAHSPVIRGTKVAEVLAKMGQLPDAQCPPPDQAVLDWILAATHGS
jgi:hypothetical protein